GVPQTVLPINTFNALGSNALTGDSGVGDPLTEGELPNTFVPGRNLIFLTFAAAHAYQHGIHDLVVGVCQTDYSGYPDCRQNTVDALQVAINLGMESRMRIHTPLMWLTKAESVRLAEEVGALEALSWSHTCYNGEFPPCGRCPACDLRAKGFAKAGIPDPLVVRASV
ncbi:MAG TPA: 7-cyano-7-deazaguanine synthase QueC, partial [Deltaproteobacteria bacterium]|nr:7-cyano-7-deazaguanine synthase QueC [Deltaproteobacteria bacterium]